MYRLSSKSNTGVEEMVREREATIKDLRQRLDKAESLLQAESPLLKTKEINLLESSKLVDEREVLDMKTKLRLQDEDIIRLKNINDKLKEENIMVNSKAIGLEHDISLN